MANTNKRAVKFWSAEHANSVLGMKCDTYQELCHAERVKGAACSTTLIVDDEGIEGVVRVFNNESYGTLSYHDDVPTTLRLVAYRGADYDEFMDAAGDGAIYDLGATLVMGEHEKNANTYQIALNAMLGTSKMINSGDSSPALSFVDDGGNTIAKHWREVPLNDAALTYYFTQDFIDKVIIGFDEDIPR